MGKQEKKLPPIPFSIEGFKNALKERAGTFALCFKEITKFANDFFLLFFGDLTCQQMENVPVIHADGTFEIVP